MCRIVRPGDPDYDQARTDFNLRFDVRPQAILFACNTADVVDGVRMARDKGIELRARAGGHSFEAYSLVEDGLVIDVSPIAHVRVAKDLRTARIGAGIKLGEVYRQLWDASHLAIPAGSCPTVGATGLTLGGGFGFLSRQRGLTCDAIVEAEMVTADGDVVRASEDENPDLFWALRGGGGGNFGIVTELTFRVEPIGDVALTVLLWPPEQLSEMIDGWQRWTVGIDRRLVSVTYFPPPDQSPRVVALLDGAPDELRALIQPLLEVGTPKLEIPPYSTPWIDFTRSFGGSLAAPIKINGIPSKFKSSSAYLFELLPPEAIATMIENLRRAPGLDYVQFDNWGGAVSDVAPDSTAFFHRGALASLQLWSSWADDSEEPAHLAWVDAIRRAMLPWTRGAYVNYIDGDIADWPVRYHGDNFDRLRQVKRAWDPENVFHFPQSIPP
jgi:FAD/FMN-containing dehydrogenase